MRRLTVVVNLTWLVPGVVGGSEESTTSALRAVLDVPHDDVDLRAVVLPSFVDAHPDLAAALRCATLRVDGRNKARRVLAEQFELSRVTASMGADVVHHAGGVVPLRHPGSIVLTVHDLQPLDLPQNFSLVKRSYLRAMSGRSVRAAQVVCVPSEFTQRRVVAHLGVDGSRVAVVPWFVPERRIGAGAEVREDAHLDAEQTGAGLAAGLQGTRYFLYPAVTYPHKNHLVLLEAFAQVATKRPDVRLVLTGAASSTEPAVAERMARPDLAGKVLRPGRVPAATLESLYASAAAVVVPSRYEGFGLPVLEAMSWGCPVICSDAGSLPEVARPQDLVDPDDVTAWASAMQSVLDLSDAQRAERVASGHDAAARFNAGRTAEALLGAYRRAGAHLRRRTSRSE